jgi:hypothetical protein
LIFQYDGFDEQYLESETKQDKVGCAIDKAIDKVGYG